MVNFPDSFIPECGKPYSLDILMLGGINSIKNVKNTFYFGIGDFGARDDYMRPAKSHLFMGVDSNGALRGYTCHVAKKMGEVPIKYFGDVGDDEPAYPTIRVSEIDLNLSFLEEDYAIGRINYYTDVREELSTLITK